MEFIVRIGVLILKFFYFFIKFFPQKNKIVFISRQSNNVSVDFKLLGDKLSESYEVVYLCKMIDKGFGNKIKYFFHMFKQMYHISTSKIVVLDSYAIVIGILKHKKNLKIIQMWHALGAFKKFGKSIIGKKESNVDIEFVNKINSDKLSKIMGMHKNYDYIFASSELAVEGFSEAFGYPKSKFKIYPLPRLDLIIDKKNREEVIKKIYSKYKTLKGKKNILYCPTFRKDNSDIKYIKELINKIDYKKYNLILKLHPLTKMDIDDKRVIIAKEFNTYEMAFVSDVIITDYSAVIYEVSLLNTPICLYAYDKDTYIDSRDFYLDYDKDMPGKIYSNVDNMLSDISNEKYNMSKLSKFNNNYINKYKVSYTDDIVNFIKSLVK